LQVEVEVHMLAQEVVLVVIALQQGLLVAEHLLNHLFQ
jgi:hypothetical protein